MRTVILGLLTILSLMMAVAVRADLSPPSRVSLEIKVDKLFLLPGETQFVTVTGRNNGPASVHLPVALSLSWDLSRTRLVGRTSMTIPAGGRAVATFAFPAGPGLFGYEARVADPDDPSVAPSSACFTVHHNLWQVSMQGDGLTAGGVQNPLTTEEDRMQKAAAARASLCNTVEFFAWAPDDFSALDPETNVWYAGQTSYPASKLALHESIDAFHAVGATVATYAKGQMGGPEAFAFFQRNPEWTGAPYNSTWSVRDLKQFDTKSPFAMGDQKWPRAMTDFGSWPIAYAHIKQLRLAANEFRFDAVRYDDHLQVSWVDSGYNPMTARNMEQIITRLRLARPYFGFGFNWITGNVKAAFARHDGAPTPDWPVAGSAGSQIMDEEVGQIFGNSLPPAGLPWSDYIKRLLSDRAMAEPEGGKVFVMQNRRLAPVDAAYRNALVLALRLFHTNYDATAPDHFALFATRYSCLLRAEDPMEMTFDQVQIMSARPVWSDGMAYRYDLGGGHGRIVVSLINPPSTPNIGTASAGSVPPEFPAPLEQVRLKVALPAGWQAASATAIDAATLQATSLPARGGSVDLTLPPVAFWSVVAIDCAVTK